MRRTKSTASALIILVWLVAGCANANKALYDDLSQIPGGFSELSMYGGSVWATTSLDALNGRFVEGEFIIEQLIWTLNSPFANFKYLMKGFRPDAPVGEQIRSGQGRFVK